MIAALLLGLAKANLAAGAAVLAVLAARRIVRMRFGARAAYALWLAPLAAAAAVLVPHPQLATPMSPMMLSAETAAAGAVDAIAAQAPASARAAGPDQLYGAGGLLVAGWLAGALAAGALLFRRQARFVRTMGRLTPSVSPRVFCAQSPDVGPAVVGVFRPRIVAPADFDARFAPAERDLILAHEGAHLAGGDAAVNALASALQCLSWFNPLVHVGVRVLRIDQELACDAAVIGRFPQMRRAYAELLLKTQIASQPLPLGCHWPARADHPLKERIAMLKSPLPAMSMRAAGLAVAGLATLSAGGLAWAAQPGPGTTERAAAEAFNALHPNYSCDPALEARGGGCKIMRVPVWLALPTRDDILRAYPRDALSAGTSAEVRISCAMTTDGLLKTCAPVETFVTTANGGAASEALKAAFGQAAVTLSRYYQAPIPKTPNPRAGHALLPVFFSPDGSGRPPPGGRPDGRPMPDLPPPPAAPAARPTPASAARNDQMTCVVGADRRLTDCAMSRSSPEFRKLLASTRAALEASAPGSYTPPPGFAEPRTNGQPGPSPARSIWLKKPTGDELMAVYPADAVKEHVAADLTLTCHVAADGRLYDCANGKIDLSADTAAGLQPGIGDAFKAASLKLAALFQMDPAQVAEKTGPDRIIRIPIRFRLPQPAQPAPSAN